MPVNVPSVPYDIPSQSLASVDVATSYTDASDYHLTVIGGVVKRINRGNLGLARIFRSGSAPTFTLRDYDLWFDTNTNTIKIYYSGSWNSFTPAAGGLASGVVTDANLADMPAFSIKARPSGTTGVPSNLVLSANNFIARASTGVVEAKAISDYGLTLVNTANAGALKIALSLGTMADETATDYLTKAGNLSGLIDVATARTNLGLGTMAVEAAATYPTKANNLSDLASVVTARVNLDLRGQEPLAILTSADLNTTSDQAIPLPTGSYIIDNVIFTNASATPTVAAGGVYTSSAKGGTQIVANSQVYTSLSSATKYLDATLHADTATTTYSGSLYLSLTTAEGSALTADVYVYGKRLR